jgi:hypothetical protein
MHETELEYLPTVVIDLGFLTSPYPHLRTRLFQPWILQNFECHSYLNLRTNKVQPSAAGASVSFSLLQMALLLLLFYYATYLENIYGSRAVTCAIGDGNNYAFSMLSELQ